MLVWIKPAKSSSYDQDWAAWKVDSIEESFTLLKKILPFNWFDAVCYITDENRNVLVSKNKFKRMLNTK